MKNNEFIFNIIDDLPDELIEKARPKQYSEKKNLKKPFFLWLIPSFAACIALIIIVNHFTDMKNLKSPEVEISVVSEVTTTAVSDAKTNIETTVPTSKRESEKILTTDSSVDTTKTVTTTELSEITTSKNLHVLTSISEISSVLDTPVITASVQETPTFSSTSVTTVSVPAQEEIPTFSSDTVTTVSVTLPTTSETSSVTSITSKVSESITTEVIYEEDDLFTEVLNSFGKNTIVLDYTRNDYNRKALVITEDGEYQYFSDGKLIHAIIKMKNGKSLPVNEINEKINSKMIFLMENSTDEYEIMAPNKEKLEYIYTFLNYDDIETIDEYCYVDKYPVIISEIMLNSNLSQKQIIKKYSALNLFEYEYEDEYDNEKWKYCLGCSPDKTNNFYVTISDMLSENIDFKFNIELMENFSGNHYAIKEKNIYKNKSNSN